MALQRERILILAKTYPSPSTQYVETSCVAGINQVGTMRRLYPVPFRMLEDRERFKKWQWIEAGIEKAKSDHRPESYKVDVGTLKLKEVIAPRGKWAERRLWLDKIPTFGSYDAMEQARQNSGLSLARLCPKKVLGLEIRDARSKDWTEEEKEKLMRAQMQGDLFPEDQARQQVFELRKVPFDFYYAYLCETPDGEKEHRHKIVDWEAGALYWNCHRHYGSDWERPFGDQLNKLIGKDLTFLMGTIHRFPGQWLIVSLFYPPRQMPVDEPQMPLF